MAKRGEDSQPRLWTPMFVAILVTTLCCFIVGQGLNSGTSVYISRVGGTATLAGVGAAVFSAAAAVARIVCGPIIDQRGRIVVVSAGAVVMLAGVLGSAISASLDLFVLWRFLQGVGFAAATTAAATAAADVLPAERLGEGIGYYGLGQAVSMSFGPALALFLVSTDPAENLFWGLTASAALAFALSLLCRYERNPLRLPATSAYRRRYEAATAKGAGKAGEAGPAGDAEPGEGAPDSGSPAPEAGGNAASASGAAPFARECIRQNPLLQIFEPGALTGGLPMMVMSPAFGFGIFFVGLYGTRLGVGSPGVFYTVSAFAMIAVRLLSHTFMDRVAPIKLMIAAAASGLLAYGMLLAAGLLGAGSAACAPLLYAAGVPYGLCLGMALPVNQSVAVKNSPAERWGAANALFLLLNDVGIGTGAVVWGMTNDAFGFPATICCVLACIAASVAVAFASYPASGRGAAR